MFEKFKARLKKIKTDELMRRAVVANEPKLVRAQRAQLNQGRDMHGDKITPPYSWAYKRVKARRGLPTNRVTLKLTGELHGNFRVEADSKGFAMATDRTNGGFDVADHLQGRYGDVYGVKEVIEIIKPEFIREFKRNF